MASKSGEVGELVSSWLWRPFGVVGCPAFARACVGVVDCPSRGPLSPIFTPPNSSSPLKLPKNLT